ncbi:MAG TPA: TerC family protein [Gemmatimonadales bacterium]|nr:TerC family protein [Gemmatimonadales bacterium]
MHWLLTPENWIALVTLTILEIVLNVDNVIFLTIVSGGLPEAQRPRAQRIGLFLAMLLRIALLASLTWLIGLTVPLFTALGRNVSIRDLILIGGGLFLLAKATREIHDAVEAGGERVLARPHASFGTVILQIVLLDLIFSIDSVITAVGMANHLGVMVTAVIVAIGVMMISARAVGEIVERHPSIRMLALSFLLLVAFSLIAEGLGRHIEKGYIYFAMGFSVMVEALNLRAARGGHRRAQAGGGP